MARFKLFVLLSVLCLLSCVSLGAKAAVLDSSIRNPKDSLVTGMRNGILVPQIVGGVEASEGQFPFFVTIIVSLHIFVGAISSSFCGGSFLTPKYVLTAAHCLGNGHEIEIGGEDGSRIYYGSLEPKGGNSILVTSYYVHPEYNPTMIRNDFAILELASDADVGIISSVTLDDGSSGDHVGDSSTVCGFGATQWQGSMPSKLLYVDLDVLPDSDCVNVTGGPMDPSQLCAGGRAGKDSCQGDSGGPLVLKGSNTQIGIVSLGVECASPRYPGAIYSRVSDAYEWITKILAEADTVKRCGTCSATNQCEGSLSCAAPGYCQRHIDEINVCESECCAFCGCSNNAVCVKKLLESCGQDCDCVGDTVCQGGICQLASGLSTAKESLGPTSIATPTSEPTTTTPTATPPVTPTGMPTEIPTATPDCYPMDGEVVLTDGRIVQIRDLKKRDLVFDGMDYTRVVLIVDMHKGSDGMMYIDGKPVATHNHAMASGLHSSQYELKPHDSVYLVFTESRYIQIHGIRVSNYISAYPTWLQELGIQMVDKSRVVGYLVSKYRPSHAWHVGLTKLIGSIQWIWYVVLVSV